MSRATMSLALPAVNGLTTKTGRLGQSCARANWARPIVARTATQTDNFAGRDVIAPYCDMNGAGPPARSRVWISPPQRSGLHLLHVACRPRSLDALGTFARPTRLDPGRDRRVVRSAVPRIAVSCAKHPSPVFRPERGADFHLALDQDRRMPGGLRLLSAERALSDRRRR